MASLEASEQVKSVSEENKQATYDVLTSATLSDNSELSGEVSQRVVTARLGSGQPVHDATEIGRELASDTDTITHGLCGEGIRQEQVQAWKRVWETFKVLIDMLLSDPTVENRDSLKIIDGGLCASFDKAVDCLISSTSGNQSVPESVETFLKCVLLAVSLVKHYKQIQTTGTHKEALSRVVFITGYLLIRTGIRYNVYTWVTRRGWQGVRRAVHNYIVGTHPHLSESNDYPVENTDRNTHPRWQNAVFFVGGVLLITYAYYRYHYS